MPVVGKLPLTEKERLYIKNALSQVASDGTAAGAFAGFPMDKVRDRRQDRYGGGLGQEGHLLVRLVRADEEPAASSSSSWSPRAGWAPRPPRPPHGRSTRASTASKGSAARAARRASPDEAAGVRARRNGDQRNEPGAGPGAAGGAPCARAERAFGPGRSRTRVAGWTGCCWSRSRAVGDRHAAGVVVDQDVGARLHRAGQEAPAQPGHRGCACAARSPMVDYRALRAYAPLVFLLVAGRAGAGAHAAGRDDQRLALVDPAGRRVRGAAVGVRQGRPAADHRACCWPSRPRAPTGRAASTSARAGGGGAVTMGAGDAAARPRHRAWCWR